MNVFEGFDRLESPDIINVDGKVEISKNPLTAQSDKVNAPALTAMAEARTILIRILKQMCQFYPYIRILNYSIDQSFVRYY